MSKVVWFVSVSLDWFTSGPNARDEEPMGDGGERLLNWMAGEGSDGEIDIGVRQEVDAADGAAVIGRRTFDLGLGPWGGTPWPGVPSFVVTHRTRQDPSRRRDTLTHLRLCVTKGANSGEHVANEAVRR